MGCRAIEVKTGTKFTRLTVTSKDVIYTKKGEYKYHCICKCGNEGYYASSKLRSGHTKSCGCLRKDMRKLVKIETMIDKDAELTPETLLWVVSTKKELENTEIVLP